jgi:predicted TIM-barrel fold metal-dependent hydrolase
MRVNDMFMISIDDHLIEPPDVFDHHMPEKYRSQAPKLYHMPDGSDRWVFQGYQSGHMGLGSVATWPKSEWNMDPSGYAEMRPGCYDVHERIRDMNAGGLFASMCFPTFAGFAGTHLARPEDPKLTAMAFSAYNDWHIEEWAGAYPGRFIPLGILPLRDPDAMVVEVRRISAKGVTAVSLPETPHVMGLPSFYSGYWDPVFAACNDEEVVVCLHIGQAYNAITQPEGVPEYHRALIGPQLSALALSDLVVAGVFRRYPTLKVAMSEGGIGWIPFYLDKVDRYVVNQAWTGLVVDDVGRTPTQLFRDQVLACFITDPTTLEVRNRIGVGSIAWECDYPHSDSTWPQGPDTLLAECEGAGLTDQEIEKITWENAARFFRFDPFAFTPRERGTVGALRALAGDVDLSTTSKEEYRRRYESRAQSAR